MNLKDWVPRALPCPAVLSGRYARLEKLDWQVHRAGLYAAVCGDTNDDLWTYMPFAPFADPADLQKRFEEKRRAAGWHTLIIRHVETSVVLGMASYIRIRPGHGSAEVGCVTFGPALQRTSQATEAIFLMGAHLFDDLGYRRYEWKCGNANLASKRAAMRFGFQYEGLFRNDMVRKGRNRDTAWFSMIDADWPHLKNGFETWLAPENFDCEGHQLKRLEECR